MLCSMPGNKSRRYCKAVRYLVSGIVEEILSTELSCNPVAFTALPNNACAKFCNRSISQESIISHTLETSDLAMIAFIVSGGVFFNKKLKIACCSLLVYNNKSDSGRSVSIVRVEVGGNNCNK